MDILRAIVSGLVGRTRREEPPTEPGSCIRCGKPVSRTDGVDHGWFATHTRCGLALSYERRAPDGYEEYLAVADRLAAIGEPPVTSAILIVGVCVPPDASREFFALNLEKVGQIVADEPNVAGDIKKKVAAIITEGQATLRGKANTAH